VWLVEFVIEDVVDFVNVTMVVRYLPTPTVLSLGFGTWLSSCR
jgi:hypothetical protein